MKKEHIVLAADHAGFKLKESLKLFFKKKGYNITDVGAHTLLKTDDYPKYIAKAAREVQKSPQNTKAIIIGGSGQGEAMVANSFQNVRAAVYYGGSQKIIKLSREHNNANVLSLGARFMSEAAAKKAVEMWLATEFSEKKRHIRRIRKVRRLK